MAKRYPGLLEEAWTMTISEENIPEVLTALQNLGVKVVPLMQCHGLE